MSVFITQNYNFYSLGNSETKTPTGLYELVNISMTGTDGNGDNFQYVAPYTDVNAPRQIIYSSDNYVAYGAFENDYPYSYYWQATVNSSSYTGIFFQLAQIITKYKLVAYTDGYTWYAPTSFKLQGSQNNSSWTDLQSTVTVTPTEWENLSGEYVTTVNNGTRYLYYRMLVSAAKSWTIGSPGGAVTDKPTIKELYLYRTEYSDWPVPFPTATRYKTQDSAETFKGVDISVTSTGTYTGYGAYMALNNDPTYGWVSDGANYTDPTPDTWWQMQLSSPLTPKNILVDSNYVSGIFVPSFTVLASMNGTTYTSIGSVTNSSTGILRITNNTTQFKYLKIRFDSLENRGYNYGYVRSLVFYP